MNCSIILTSGMDSPLQFNEGCRYFVKMVRYYRKSVLNHSPDELQLSPLPLILLEDFLQRKQASLSNNSLSRKQPLLRLTFAPWPLFSALQRKELL